MSEDLNVPDISNLNFAQLAALKATVTERMTEMRETGITQLRATIAEQADMLGVGIKDLMPKTKKRGRPRKPDSE